MTDLNKIPDDELTALMRIYEEYLVTIERHEPSESSYESYKVICEELKEIWHSTQYNEKLMSDQEVMEVLIRDVGALVVLWWMWNEGVKKNDRPEQNTD